jgi:hypothetical protein
MNRFEWKADHLHHYFNDELRAVVASEHAIDYLVAIAANLDDVPMEETL